MLAKRDKLALCLILKDEAETIKDVIEAFWLDGKPLYDDLVIGIDKSTKDNTLEVVKPYTKQISFFDWNDDFSTPRNELIQKIPKNCICAFPDGHEVMRPYGKYVINEFLQKAPKNVNLFSPWFEMDVDEYDIPDVLFKRPVIFRNTGHVLWERTTHNYLHDKVVNAIMAIPEMSFVHNMPAERKKMRSDMRKVMNKKRLKESLEKNPDDLRDTFYYADVMEERESFDEAIGIYSDLFEKVDRKNPDLAAQTCVSIMNALSRAERYEEMAEWGHKGLQNRYDRAELFYYLGVSAYNLGKYQESIQWYNCALPGGQPMEIPETIYFLLAKVYSWLPWEGLMNARKKIGNYEGSIDAIDEILHFLTSKKTKKPHPVYLRNKLVLRDFLRNEKKSQQLINETGIVDQVKSQFNVNSIFNKNGSEKIGLDNSTIEVV